MSLNEMSFTLCGDEIRGHADTVFLPVDVLDKDGAVILRHEVALKAEFYRELRSLPDWVAQLHKICQSRVLKFMQEREQKAKIHINDKLELFDAKPMSLQSTDIQ